MNEVQEIDVEQIMERIRENIKRRRSAGDIPAPERDTSTFLHGQVAADLAYLHSGYDITNVPLVSHRRVLGSLVLATKKAIRKLLAPILERQVAYNAASTRVATHLKDGVEAQGRISDTLRVEIAALEARLRAEMLTAESRSVRAARNDQRGAARATTSVGARGACERRCGSRVALRRGARRRPSAPKRAGVRSLAVQSQALQALRQSSVAAQRTDLQDRTDVAPDTPRFPDSSAPGEPDRTHLLASGRA